MLNASENNIVVWSLLGFKPEGKVPVPQFSQMGPIIFSMQLQLNYSILVASANAMHLSKLIATQGTLLLLPSHLGSSRILLVWSLLPLS